MMLSTKKLHERAQQIRLLILDVDGVLTDGQVYFTDTGMEIKSFHVHDGLGIKLVLEAGIEVAVISGRHSKVVTQRMHELGVKHVFQGNVEKTPAYETLKNQLGLSDHEIAYIGDDLPDLPVLQRVGLSVCVANAHPKVKQATVMQTHLAGGHGAVREVCDLLLQVRE